MGISGGISFKEIMAMPLASSPLDAPPPAVLWLERSAKKDRKVDEVYGDCRVNSMPWATDDNYLKIILAFFANLGDFVGCHATKRLMMNPFEVFVVGKHLCKKKPQTYRLKVAETEGWLLNGVGHNMAGNQRGTGIGLRTSELAGEI